MKKTAMVLLIGLALFLLLPAGAGASQPYRVAGYTGEMVMSSDGSLSVTEYITWKVDGAPVIERKLDISSATEVMDFAVYRVMEPDLSAPEDAARATMEKSAGNGPDTYDWNIIQEGNGRYMDIMLRPDTQKRYVTLVFSYRFTDCAYMYQDGAAYSFNPLWRAGEGNLGSFFMHCRLGNIEAGDGTPHYYANGGLIEEWTEQDLYASQVDLTTGLEVVAVLPVSWVPLGRKAVMNDILPHLDAQQQIYHAQREEALALREETIAQGRLTLWVALGVMAGGMLLILILYGVRPPRRRQKHLLLPSRHLPGEVPLLLRRPLRQRTALAELIYLWHRGFLRFVLGEDGQWELKPEKRSDEQLTLPEQYLLSWMVHRRGGPAHSVEEKLDDTVAFGIWKGLVKKAVAQKGILKEARAARIIGLGLGIMEWVLAAMIVRNTQAWDMAILVGLMGLMVAGYGCTVRNVTVEEMREQARYRRYARHLRCEKGCTGPWRRQLAYAMVLGADRRLLRILIRKGSDEVSDFARWVKMQRRHIEPADLSRLKPSFAKRGKWPKPFRYVKAARHEAAAARLMERGRHGEKKYRKPDLLDKHRIHGERTYRKPNPKKWPPRGMGKR